MIENHVLFISFTHALASWKGREGNDAQNWFTSNSIIRFFFKF